MLTAHYRRRSRRLQIALLGVRRRRRSLLHNCEYRRVGHIIYEDTFQSTKVTNHPVDLSELSLGSTMKTKFPNADDILNFNLSIEPDEGMYKGGAFNFNFAINQNFPHDPPKVKCVQKIYHPNIDLQGNVCLNILREDWKPVLNLNAVIVGLQVSLLSEKHP